MKIAYLKVSTWVGSACVWAEHYYGVIKIEDQRYDVTALLSKAEAERLNRGEDYKDPDIRSQYKAGEESGRFTDKAELFKAGIELFNKYHRDYTILLGGSDAILDPQEMLVGPPDIIGEANVLWKQFEEYNGWGCHRGEEKKVQSICDAWELIIYGKPWQEWIQEQDG
ncbi:MAG: hypothetical protein KAR39_04570 [Thermoplasmata archaeon]|nr:hypothetical protein [Thermoplasmata archaeon]